MLFARLKRRRFARRRSHESSVSQHAFATSHSQLGSESWDGFQRGAHPRGAKLGPPTVPSQGLWMAVPPYLTSPVIEKKNIETESSSKKKIPR